MAELTHLNEPSVVHNLFTRYQADLIYVSLVIRCGFWDDHLLIFIDLFWPLPCYGKPVLSFANLQQRIHQNVQRAESGG